MDDILILIHKQILDVFGFSENDFSIFKNQNPLLQIWNDCQRDFKEFYRRLSPEQKIIISKWMKQILDVIFEFSENDFSIFEKENYIPLLQIWKRDFKEFYRQLSPEQKIIISKWMTSFKKYLSHALLALQFSEFKYCPLTALINFTVTRKRHSS
jgi:hypothetical protein